MSDLPNLSGKFIVFDGPDGCGKTTQMKLLVAKLEKAGVKVRQFREPGGTLIGEQIRPILLDTKNHDMDIRCEMLLYMASRAQLVQQEIRPALAAGECVVADRFVSSTLAYQGGGGGMNLDDIHQAARIATDGTFPDLTIIFDLDTATAMARLGSEKDRIEQRPHDYFERVRQNYLWQTRQWPERYRTVDAAQEIPRVEEQVIQVLREFFT